MSKFYQLNHDEWLKACKELTSSEKDVLYFIRTLDPYSKGIKVNASAIALELGVNRSTVSRALKNLGDKQYIDLEILVANVTIKGKGLLHTRNTVAPTQQNEVKNDVASAHSLLHSCTPCCIPAQHVAPTQHDTLESGSGHGSVFSKISLDQLEDLRSDRSGDFVDFSNANSENSQVAIAIENPKVDDANKCDLKAIEQAEDRISPVKHINRSEGDSPRRALEDFILKQMKFSPRDRTAYFSKFKAKDWEDWEIKFNPPSSPPPPPLFVPEIVEVCDPEIALANLAKIREMLKRGAK